MIYKLYEDSMIPAHKISKEAHIKVGITLGFNQFSMYCVMASMFYIGGVIIKGSIDEDGKSTLKPRDVFTAIFSIMFGAMNAGTAAAYGPDMGKAKSAALRIFKIMEYPSAINAMDETK